MADTSNNFETLDLRFRAPQKARGTWLPGGAWVWFLLGTTLGIGGWIYGRKELTVRLAKQVTSDNSASTSLFALEALHSLDPTTIDHLVVGLHHPDPRVARSAYQKINLHIDQWLSADIALQFAAMKSLAVQLQRTPNNLPESNLALVRSVAARLYSSSVSIDDPQVKPVTEICQRLLAKEIGVDASTEMPVAEQVRQLPPAPLPPLVDRVNMQAPSDLDSQLQTTTPNDSQPIHRSSSQPVASLRLVASPTRKRTNSTIETSAVEPTETHSARLSDESGNSAGLSDQSELVGASDSSKSQMELPVVVATPASISTQPVAQLKVVSSQPDLAGIEKLQIAELIRLLAHENADVAKAAALGLRHQGMSDSKIQLASELAMGSAGRRLELIQQLATSGEMDPRPWLVWMGEDGEPEVRKMAISLLIPMADENVYRSLRKLAARENDSHIRDLITRALISASR